LALFGKELPEEFPAPFRFETAAVREGRADSGI
jgi:hypothetical protein